MPAVLDQPVTHQDRPVTKVMLPFRVIPGRPMQVEYDQIVLLADKTTRRIEMRLPIESSPWANQVGYKIQQMMDIYFLREAELDGLLKRVTDLEVTRVEQDREIDKLKNQLAEALRQVKNGKVKNGS